MKPMPNFREVYDDMMTNNNSSDESSSDVDGSGFVEDLHATKRQISGGGKKKRARKSTSPPKKKARKSKSPKKKARKSKSPKKKARKSKSPKKARKSKSPAKKKRKSDGIPQYPTAKSRAGRYRAVFEGRAQKTGPGGLTKSQLTQNSAGKIVSKAKSSKATNEFMKKQARAREQGLESFFHTGKDGIEREYFRRTTGSLTFYRA